MSVRANIRRLAVAAGVVSTAALIGLPGAGAADVVVAGWWSSSPVLPANDVPEDGLLVQSGPSDDAPLAYAAVAFRLDPGETPVEVVLTIASESATTPGTVVMACEATGAITQSAGSPATDGPSYDCTDGIEVEADALGSAYAFDATPFTAGGIVSVAVVPSGPVGRVAFDAPSATSLRTNQAPTTTTSAPPDTGGTPPVATTAPPPTFGGQGPASPLPDLGASAPPPSEAPDVTSPTDPDLASAPAPSLAPESASAPIDADPPVPTVLGIIGLAGAVAAWVWAGRPTAAELAPTGGAA